MKIISPIKAFLVVLILLILSIALTGCIDIVVPPIDTGTGTVKLVVHGNHTYDLKMDGITKFYDKPADTYTLFQVQAGTHTFEAIDTMGASFGYDDETKYIPAGKTTYVYLYPDPPSPTTGTLEVVIMDDPGYVYDVYLDGNQNTGEYLGSTSGSSVQGQNSKTFSGIPTGSQTIFVISEDEKYSKYRFPYIVAGETITINVYVK